MIEAREEFEDVDLVFPWQTPFQLTRHEHTYVKPWYVRYNDGEEIRVTVNEVKHHHERKYPLYINFQRYIVGRPNLLCMPIYPV